MRPSRVDSLADPPYGIVILPAGALTLAARTGVGVASGIGAPVPYVIHVGLETARFAPAWISRGVTDPVEQTLSGEIVAGKASVTEPVTGEIGDTVTGELAGIVDRLERVNKRIHRRPCAGPLGDEAAAGDDRGETTQQHGDDGTTAERDDETTS